MSIAAGVDNSKRGSGKARGISKQNQRLTGRHIQALIQLQDVTLENEKLQSRLDILEKELSSCFELHEVARGAQKSVENARKTHEDAIDSLKKELCVEKENELHTLKEIHAEEKRKLKKVELKLQSRIEELEQQNHEHMEVSQQFSKDSKRIQELENDCRFLRIRLDEAEIIIDEKTRIESDLLSEVETLRREHADILSKFEKQKCLLLGKEKRLEEEKLLKEKFADQNYTYTEINSLNEVITELKRELGEKEKTCGELTDENESLKRHVHDVENRLFLLEMERDAVKQSADDLRSDVDYLRTRVSNVKIGHSDFTQPGTDGRKVSSEERDHLRKKSVKSSRSCEASLTGRKPNRISK